MVKRLLNLYIKYVKEKDKKVWKKISSLPGRIRFQMGVTIGSLLLTILSSILTSFDIVIFNRAEMWPIICTIACVISAIIAVVLCAVLQISIGKYEVEISIDSMNEYWAYCRQTKKWIVDVFDLKDTKETNVVKEIEIIKDRVDTYRKDLNDDAEKKANRVDKWIQTLAIPFVLAIITAVIDKNDDVSKAVAIIISIILVGVVVFGIVWLINIFNSLLRKQKSEQLKLFSEDLQGIIDAEHYCSKQDN